MLRMAIRHSIHVSSWLKNPVSRGSFYFVTLRQRYFHSLEFCRSSTAATKPIPLTSRSLILRQSALRQQTRETLQSHYALSRKIDQRAHASLLQNQQTPPSYEPTSGQREQLDSFVAFLFEENQKFNLTGAKTIDELHSRHIDDCLSLLPALDMAAAAAEQQCRHISEGSCRDDPGDQTHSNSAFSLRVLDIGSGAGLPGLLLAICRPQWEVVMLDSLKKRCKFLDAAIERLHLTNASTLWARAEDAGHTYHHREAYEVVTARAVADMRVLAELTLPFVRPGGRLAVAKGALPQDEVASAEKAIKDLGGDDTKIIPVASHGPKGQRTAVLIVKAARTNSLYPRSPNQISKRPL